MATGHDFTNRALATGLLSSLNFATRVRGVELGPAKKQIDLGEFQKLKIQLDKSKQELRSKDEALLKLDENIRVFESRAKSKEQFGRSQQEKVNELENQLVVKADLCRQMDRQLTELTNKLEEGSEDYNKKRIGHIPKVYIEGRRIGKE